MDKIAIILVFAVITEALVNLFFEDIPQSKIKKYIAYGIGVLLTVVWKIGMLTALDVVMPNVFASHIDYILTGVFCSRGSNYIHQLVMAVKGTYTNKIP